MKKSIIIYSLLILFATLYACDPLEDGVEMDHPLSAADLDVTARSVIVNGVKSNKIILENHSPINSEWNYGIGLSQRSCDTILLVLEGKTTIVFTGRNQDGSYITKELPVDVEELSFPVAPQWGYLCGTGKKSWTWNETAGAVFGNGGYLIHKAPTWWKVNVEDMDNGDEPLAPGEGKGAQLEFSILGGATLTKTLTDGTTQAGTFSFVMDEAATDETWSKGKLLTKDVNVLFGVDNDNNKAPYYEYDIMQLDDNNMYLAAPKAGVNSAWGGCFYWVFRPI